jgi:hypothetical protein
MVSLHLSLFLLFMFAQDVSGANQLLLLRTLLQWCLYKGSMSGQRHLPVMQRFHQLKTIAPPEFV